MEAIANWLKNKDYQKGVSLYHLHGSSDFLKKIFEAGEGDYTRQKLEEELTALLPKDSKSQWRDLEYKEIEPSSVDKSRFVDENYYKRHVLGSWPPEEAPKEPSKLNGRVLDVIYIDEAVNIPYKEKQPSSQDNIQYLKLIRRRNDLNRQITRNMALLDASTSKARRFETAKQIKSLDRAKRVVWAEIDYFDQHGSIMPVAIKPEIKTDELQRLYVQIYKAEKRLEKTDVRNREKTEKLLQEKRNRVEQIRKERAGEQSN